MKTAIKTDKAPAAIGPYSQAIRIGKLLFLSGQIPLAPDGTLVTGSIDAMASQCLENIRNILAAAGADKGDIVKVTVFLTDIRDFESVNKVYAAFFEGVVPPARSLVQVAALPKGVKIEIEAVASLD